MKTKINILVFNNCIPQMCFIVMALIKLIKVHVKSLVYLNSTTALKIFTPYTYMENFVIAGMDCWKEIMFALEKLYPKINKKYRYSDHLLLDRKSVV